MKAEMRHFIPTQSLRVKLFLFQDRVTQPVKTRKSHSYRNLGSDVPVHPWGTGSSAPVSSLFTASHQKTRMVQESWKASSYWITPAALPVACLRFRRSPLAESKPSETSLSITHYQFKWWLPSPRTVLRCELLLASTKQPKLNICSTAGQYSILWTYAFLSRGNLTHNKTKWKFAAYWTVDYWLPLLNPAAPVMLPASSC